ncbi:MAG: DNA translocase FtsK [Oscillospiraceae bacterium]|nr:DNA translocase FtsK [Oscillospiraceae bacterium]
MATQKKKTSSGRTKSGQTRRASSANAPASRKRTGRPAQAAKRAALPIRRELGAAVCLVLALFTALGYFNIKALFIDLLSALFKGLFGYGFYLVPPVLVLAFYILCFHRGRPVRLRLTCALLMPVFFSILLHLFLGNNYDWTKAMAAGLWKDGIAFEGGGLVGGFLAIVGRQVCSVPGTVILILVALVFLAPIAFNHSIVELVTYLRERPHLEYEPEEEMPEPEPVQEPVREKRPKPQFQDVPMDDIPAKPADELTHPAPEVETLQPKKKSFFNRKPNVKTPDEVLTGESVFEEETPSASEEVSAVTPTAVDVPAADDPVESAPVQEPAIAKVTKDEAAQAAAEVAKDIEQVMEQDVKPYQYPPLSLLNEGNGGSAVDAMDELNANRQRLNDTIHSFGIDASITNTVRGPSVTRHELELDPGVKLSKLTNLADDIALALGATGVRIAPIPDKISVVGIEVPNKVVSPVSAHAVIGSNSFTGSKSKISFAVGKDISGNCVVGDIGKLPHLLIAGTTGSGKSVCTNTIITSLLYKATPDEVRLIMVDPKMVELGIYNGIPHLLIPVVTDPKKAAGALQWAVTEMMKRYRTFSEVGVRKLEEYNALAAKNPDMDKMPAVVVIIDELADLMLVAAKEVEESICRVAQMGRAAGMHLVIATQRPSADVITGLMKANIPSRIAFAVASAMESRIILDTMGAEKLVGRGDMLFAPLGSGKPTRVQGCFISDEEVARVVDFVKQSGCANYSDEVMHEIEQHAAEKEKNAKGVGGAAPDAVDDGFDELLSAAIDVVIETGQASVSMLQRRLKLGYARAARLVDQMEEKGVVGPFEGSKPRQLLITKEQWQEMQYRQNMPAPTQEQTAMPEMEPTCEEDDLVLSEEDKL